MSGPMGPERLDSIRFLLEDDDYHVPLDKRLAVQLLAHADHWEAEARESEAMRDVAATKLLIARAEAKRYRSRCPVTAEDVEAAGVTWAGLAAVVKAGDYAATFPKFDEPAWASAQPERFAVFVIAHVDLLAAGTESCPQDILDEMAAQDTGAEVDQ